MKHLYLALAAAAIGSQAQAADIVATDAYRWHGDTISQAEYMAYSPDGVQLISTYSAQPGFAMPVNKHWLLSRDISAYPQLATPNRLHTAIYNLALEEMINAVEPDTTLRTGKEWAGVWTRDVSYSIILSMAYMQPEASKISLMRKVTPTGRIVQDTGSGGAWPVSSDRLIWCVAAYELYKVTGDLDWLQYIYPIIKNSIADDLAVTHNGPTGLVKGETSFIDWREQSYPKWMQTTDIYASEALSTSIVHVKAMRILAEIAAKLGHNDVATSYTALADSLAATINQNLWLDDKGYYAMYTYGRENAILNPRAETLGESLAILWDVAPAIRAKSITEHNPTTPFGAAIFFPQIADMPAYHNNSLWPWVAAYWTLANAKAGNEQGALEAFGSIVRPAALFTTNKENFVLDNGDIATELNSSNMLWCLAGNIAITHRMLFGLDFEADGLRFSPFVPKALEAERTLKGLKYRNATLDITIKGHGNRIKSFTVDGREQPPFLSGNITGHKAITITMANNDIEPMTVNHTANQKAPLTPITQLSYSSELGGAANNLLSWRPIEYIHHYIVLRDGQRIATTRQTTFDASTEGEYQVIGVSADGVESFASEPLDNYPTTIVEMPGESTAMTSAEISYMPQTVAGYHGKGFIEVDHKSAPVAITVDIPTAATYSIRLRYANGNGPVNTENKCAIRTLSIDGRKAGTLVMPQRGVGNWDDWGSSSAVQASLGKGRHTLTITFEPEDENMNLATNHAIIDRLIIKQIK